MLVKKNILWKILNTRCPEKVSNSALYEATNVSRWSKIKKKRRLTWHSLKLKKHLELQGNELRNFSQIEHCAKTT